MTSSAAGPSQRLFAGLGGALFTLAGAFTFLGGVRGVSEARRAEMAVFSQHDLLFVSVVTLFAASLTLAGLFLLQAAWQARRQNMVPGPTLYFCGASLLVIALFVLAAGAAVQAALVAVAALALMALEFYSDRV